MTPHDPLALLLMGGITVASIVISMFFFRFWRKSADRFFLLFALSFLIQGLNRITIALDTFGSESSILNYSIRLLAYALILVAILDKNRAKKGNPTSVFP